MTDENIKYCKEQLQAFADANLTKSGSSHYVCPACGSGTKTHKSGALSLYRENGAYKWKCNAAGCNAGGDIFNLIGIIYNLQTFKEQADKAAELYNIPNNSQKQGYKATTAERANTTSEAQKTQPPAADFSAFISLCAAEIDKTNYPQVERALGNEITTQYKLGYYTATPEQVQAAAGYFSYIPNPALIIPYNETGSYCIARSLTAGKDNRYYKPRTDKAGSEPLFRAGNLYNNAGIVYITEGQLDALSIIKAGAPAVSIGGSGHNKLVEQLKAKPTDNVIIIAPDNDEAGKESAQKLKKALDDIKAKSVIINISGTCKDANEMLNINERAFNIEINAATAAAPEVYKVEAAEAEYIAAEQHAAELDAYLETSASGRVNKFFKDGIPAGADTQVIKTGFKELDKELDGGLYEGLYILGAISSLGKTTFILQLADQLAQLGQHVLFFSLEMAATELIAKSISRETFLNCNGNENNAKTARGIMAAARYSEYTRPELELIERSKANYSKYAQNIYISEGIGDIGVKEISAAIAEHKRITGATPVIIIDYLQILAPADTRASDKQNTDRAVFELKRISRQYKTPIIGISSLNRDNYKEKLSMAAFKESGAIEYSSDVLMGLQIQGARDEKKISEEFIDREKSRPIRKLELTILKQRNAAARADVNFEYRPLFNYFIESSDTGEETKQTRLRDRI